jgi:hypothetical protein
MNSPTAAAGSLTPALMPGTSTIHVQAAQPLPSPLPTQPGLGASFDPNAAVHAQPADPMLEAIRAQHSVVSSMNSPLDRAARLGSLPSSEVAKLVIRSKGAEWGLPQGYVDLALHAQELLPKALEQDIERMSQMVAQQMFAANGGDAMDILAALRAIDERSTQLVRLQEHLRDNFQLARRDPHLAQSQLREWLGQTFGASASNVTPA